MRMIEGSKAMRRGFGLAAMAVGLFLQLPAAHAQTGPLSLRDSFQIGSGRSVLCSAQSMITDAGLVDMFDRGYTIICRDAALPVGKVYALRDRGGDPAARLAAQRAGEASCTAAPASDVADLGSVETQACRLNRADITYRVYSLRRGNTVYVAEGLGGYDSALRLALRSVVADREVAGEVSVATTGAGDPAAFARLQAGLLDPHQAMAEAYRRNNAGSYAESAEFFSDLAAREDSSAGRAEAYVNEAIQRSNLGRYMEAEALFARAEALAGNEPLIARRLRNYRAMHRLNEGLAEEALRELDRPTPPVASDPVLASLVINRAMSDQLSAESPGARRLGGTEGLSAADKARILDGQALQLRGTALRLLGRDAEASAPLTQALDTLIAVRGGRVAATVWMRAQILQELAAIAEARNDSAEAERLYLAAVTLVDANYPGSSALLSAKARLAGFYLRAGREQQTMGLFGEIVAAIEGGAEASPTLRHILAPYFALLARHGDDPASAAELFAASQVLVRPGVAQTQAVLARELSGGSDEASRLFRQSVTLTRDIARTQVELTRIDGDPNASAAERARAEALRTDLDQFRQAQVETQARLADFPSYRVVSSGAITLADVRQLLRPGEAYYKLMVVGDDAYAIFVTPAAARAFRVGTTAANLEHEVDGLRATISTVENGQQITYPFNVELAYQLYGELFGPVQADLAGVRHLIFEPDGAMLRLPPNVLIMSRAGIDAYEARSRQPGNDGFDFRGVEWLGRARDISTAVSARAFRDVRRAPPSRAREEYLGFGHNQPVGAFLGASGTRGASARDDCSWPLLAWNRPISADELYIAKRAIAAETPGGGEVVTGAAFTDTRDHGARRPQPVSHPPFRHPRPGHRAAAGMPGAARAADQLRRRRLGRAALVRRDFRSSARRRPHHSVGLRYRRAGREHRDRRGRPHRRRRFRARRAGARLHRRRRTHRRRQPLAGARRL